uniref:Receptor protein serine/threonine kinase n=1 Tax=Rhabditophanes sp. KR3021 TaxID=114890 RepID=A0AC35UAL0_9BILA
MLSCFSVFGVLESSKRHVAGELVTYNKGEEEMLKQDLELSTTGCWSQNRENHDCLSEEECRANFVMGVSTVPVYCCCMRPMCGLNIVLNFSYPVVSNTTNPLNKSFGETYEERLRIILYALITTGIVALCFVCSCLFKEHIYKCLCCCWICCPPKKASSIYFTNIGDDEIKSLALSEEYKDSGNISDKSTISSRMESIDETKSLNYFLNNEGFGVPDVEYIDMRHLTPAMEEVLVTEESTICSGQFSTVSIGVMHGSKVVVKKLQEKRRENWEAEIEVYNLLKNSKNPRYPRVLRKYIVSERLCLTYNIVLTYYEEGNLGEYLTTHLLNYYQYVRGVCNLLEGINHLHENIFDKNNEKVSIMHSDLKAHNILVRRDLKLVISDFGLSKIINSSESLKPNQSKQVGTQIYMAPELLQSATELNCISYKQIDAYALSLIIWQMSTRTLLHPYYKEQFIQHIKPYQLPYKEYLGDNMSLDNIIKVVVIDDKRPSFDGTNEYFKFTTEIKNFVQQMWAKEANERIVPGSALGIMYHELECFNRSSYADPNRIAYRYSEDLFSRNVKIVEKDVMACVRADFGWDRYNISKIDCAPEIFSEGDILNGYMDDYEHDSEFDDKEFDIHEELSEPEDDNYKETAATRKLREGDNIRIRELNQEHQDGESNEDFPKRDTPSRSDPPRPHIYKDASKMGIISSDFHRYRERGSDSSSNKSKDTDSTSDKSPDTDSTSGKSPDTDSTSEFPSSTTSTFCQTQSECTGTSSDLSKKSLPYSKYKINVLGKEKVERLQLDQLHKFTKSNLSFHHQRPNKKDSFKEKALPQAITILELDPVVPVNLEVLGTESSP